MANDEINEEIKVVLEEVYEKHLPKSQAEWLKNRLQLVEDLELQVEEKTKEEYELVKKLKLLEEENKELKSREEEVKAQEDRNKTRTEKLDKRDIDLSNREHKLENTILKVELESALRVADAHQTFLGTLTKAPIVRESIHKTVSEHWDDNVYDSNTGQYSQRKTGQEESIDKTKEVTD